MKPTLKYLAEQLNLSTSTVSKALKDSPEISEQTKERVKALAKMLNYQPNSAAASLRSKHAKTIAVILPDVVNDFFARVLIGIESQAVQNGYKIVTCVSNESLEREKAYVDMFSNGAVDGFIVAIAQETQSKKDYSHFTSVLKSGLQLVLFDRVSPSVECDKIVVDDYQSAFELVDFLVDKGDRRICVATTIADLNVAVLRENGVTDAVRLKEGVELLSVKEGEENKYLSSIEQLLSKKQTDAIIALDHKAGIMALNKANELGVKIPQDLQIICYSNSSMAQYSYPKLSVVDQHPREVGQKAFIRMFNLIHNKQDIPMTRVHTLKTNLIERGTTR